jgi:uncharacterized protein (DUF1330 family)
MPAYVIAEIDVREAAEYKEYKRLARDTIEKHHGRYRVAGGKAEGLEGTEPAGRILLLEFPDADTARGWYRSPEYQEVVRMRQRTSTNRFYLVEGLRFS